MSANFWSSCKTSDLEVILFDKYVGTAPDRFEEILCKSTSSALQPNSAPKPTLQRVIRSGEIALISYPLNNQTLCWCYSITRRDDSQTNRISRDR